MGSIVQEGKKKAGRTLCLYSHLVPGSGSLAFGFSNADIFYFFFFFLHYFPLTELFIMMLIIADFLLIPEKNFQHF